MNIQRVKKAAAGAALALTLTFGGGMILGTTAQAQDRYHNDRWQDRDDRQDRDSRYDRDRYGDRSSFEMRRGFQEGMSRGREDARDGRSFNPTRFVRFGGFRSAAYREGFNRGYAQGFRQFARNRRW